MRTLSVKEVRKQLSEVIREAEAGDSTVITRYGAPIAQIAPIRKERPKFPDLTEFRASIKVRGKPLSEVVREMRDEERF
jgi:prevent-host-death family protein